MLDTIHVLIWKLRIIEKKYIYLWGGGGEGGERETRIGISICIMSLVC